MSFFVVRAQAEILQGTDGGKRFARVAFSIGSEGDGPAQGQLGWTDVGELEMPLDWWRAFRYVLSIPDLPDAEGLNVSLMIEERGLGEEDTPPWDGPDDPV